jgi:hypothetical protein
MLAGITATQPHLTLIRFNQSSACWRLSSSAVWGMNDQTLCASCVRRQRSPCAVVGHVRIGTAGRSA